MTPERWRQIKDVFDGAIALPAGERQAHLVAACPDDGELRREVESLLASHERAAEGFLQTPVADLKSGSPEPVQGSARLGRRIGAYDLHEELGHGGMGEVYRAVRADGQFTKEVALKLVRTGLDTAFTVERFRTERQILAGLDHPNIARLLDGGTTEGGVPYLVMELVNGVAIDAFCDSRRLDVPERLRLFLQVCGAVQYAHQRLIVHRDIKPGNILVTNDAVPKLLDFGIAKIIDASVGADFTLARPMTLEYASPEQIRGEPITTATDVYALGVVLYRLLTGRSPYRADARTPHDLSTEITSAEPKVASVAVGDSSPELRRRLAGDLDNILATALRKESDRRYQSVEQLADDLEHHLRGRPVSATPDSWRYRTRKFVSRHRLALGAVAALLFVMVAGAGVSLYEARRARLEQAVAQQRFDMVRRLANAVVFEFNDALQDVPGTTAARKLIVTRAVEYLDNLTRQEAADVALARELAAAYTRIGDVLGNPYQPNLGDSAGALASYRRSVELFERLERRDRSADTRSGLAQAVVGLGSRLWSDGDGNGARANFTRAIQIYDELQRSDPRFLRNSAMTVYFLGQTELRFGEPQQARASFERARRDLQAFIAANPEDFAARRSLAVTFMKLADVANVVGEQEAAIRDYWKASGALDALVAARPSSPDIQRLAAIAWLRIADMEGSVQPAVQPAERQALARRAIRVLQPLAESDPSNSQAIGDWASAESILGISLADDGRDADALAALGVTVKLYERDLAINPGYIESRRELGDTYYRRGRIELRRSRPQAALDQFMKAQTLLEAADLAKQVPKVMAELYDDIGNAYAALAQQGDRAAVQTAASWYRKSDAKWTEITSTSRLSTEEARLRREVSHKLASAVRP